MLNKRNITIEIPPDMAAYLDLTVKEEMYIPTSREDSHIYVFSPGRHAGNLPLYVNFHGGGFIFGYNEANPPFCSKISHEVGCVVIDSDYRLAPEYPFPYAIEEGYDIVKWAYENSEQLGIDKNRIIIGGHSAGGAITAGIALIANKKKEFPLLMQLLDYAPLDHYTPAGKKIKDYRPPDGAFLNEKTMDIFESLYSGHVEDKKTPLLSPVYAPKKMLAGMPAALIITAENDLLRDEGERYALRLIQAGVSVTAKRFLNSEHGFVIYYRHGYIQAHDFIANAMIAAFNSKSF